MLKKCAVILVKCQKTKNDFGVRMEHQIQKIDNQNVPVWMCTWTYKIKPDADAHSSGASSQLNLEGNFLLSDSYLGCPYCGNKKLTLCMACNSICCSAEGQTTIVCPWDNKTLKKEHDFVTRIGGVGDR